MDDVATSENGSRHDAKHAKCWSQSITLYERAIPNVSQLFVKSRRRKNQNGENCEIASCPNDFSNLSVTGFSKGCFIACVHFEKKVWPVDHKMCRDFFARWFGWLPSEDTCCLTRSVSPSVHLFPSRQKPSLPLRIDPSVH